MVISIPSPGAERQINSMTDALPKLLLRNTEVSRIFAPHRAERRFDRISRCNTRKAHAVPLCETVELSAVLGRIIENCSPARANRSGKSQALHSNGGLHGPAKALFTG